MYTTLCKEEANSERGAQKWLIAHFLQNQPPLLGVVHKLRLQEEGGR